MSQKVQEWKHQQLTHHGLIKLVLEDALSQLKFPILCSTFRDMEKEVVIEIQALEYDKNINSSGEEEGKVEEEEEEEGEE